MPFRSPTYCKTESHGKIFFIILFSVISREKEWNKMLMAWIRLRRLKNKGCVFGRFPWHLMSNLTNIWLVFDLFFTKIWLSWQDEEEEDHTFFGQMRWKFQIWCSTENKYHYIWEKIWAFLLWVGKAIWNFVTRT